MIKRIIAVLFMIIIFTGINYFLITNARQFSIIYPINRILNKNQFTNKIDLSASVFSFKSRIIRIEDDTVYSANTLEIFEKYKNQKNLYISAIDPDGKIIEQIISKQFLNKYYFFFLLFLILFGDIHYLWGSIVFFFHPHEIRSKLYFVTSMSQSLFFFLMTDYFTFEKYKLIYFLIVTSICAFNLLTADALFFRKFNIFKTLFVLSASIILYYLIYLFVEKAGSDILFVPLIFTCIFTFFILLIFLYTLLKFNRSYYAYRNAVFLTGIITGNLLPIIIILFSALIEFPFPFYILLCLSLIFPLAIGKSFVFNTQYEFDGFRIFQAKNIKFLFFYILAASIISVFFCYVNKLGGTIVHKLIYIVPGFTGALLLLNGLYLIFVNTRKIDENKGRYADSFRDILQVTTSFDTLENKLNYMFAEIARTTGAGDLKLIIFSNINYEYYSGLKKYIEIVPLFSDFYNFIAAHQTVAIRHALIRSAGLSDKDTDEKLYIFLESRNAVLAAPVFENEKTGVLLAGEKTGEKSFSEADVYYLRTIANQAFQLIYNDWLYKDYILKRQYEKELDNSSYVQMRLFPKVSHSRDRGMDISFYYRPYLRVIGDYFDFFEIDRDKTAIIIGDVSGHGLSTAMVLSAVNGITNAVLREVRDIAKTCYEINNFLNKSYKGIELITLFIGIYDKETKVLEYVNAGHNSPLLIKKEQGKIMQIPERTKILGADPEAKYFASSILLEKDDELILYTDGIMEIYNDNTGIGIDEKDFISIINQNIEKDIESKIIEIEKTIKHHNEAIRDDITIIGAKIH